MKTKLMTAIVGGFLFAGCMRDVVPPEINEAIQALQDAYMSNDRDVVQAAPKKFGELDGKISSIEDPQARRRGDSPRETVVKRTFPHFGGA